MVSISGNFDLFSAQKMAFSLKKQRRDQFFPQTSSNF
jgi:hypothetical protein